MYAEHADVGSRENERAEVAERGQVLSLAAADCLDPALFASMLTEHRPAMHARALQLCRNRVDADDLLQESLVRALTRRAQMREPSRVRGWLFSILMNTFIDGHRHKQVRASDVPLSGDPLAPGPEPRSPWYELGVEDVRVAMAALPESLRQAYELYTFERLDYEAIADALGIPKGTVGTRLHRARRRLRALLASKQKPELVARATP